jgi:hypothetical protein
MRQKKRKITRKEDQKRKEHQVDVKNRDERVKRENGEKWVMRGGSPLLA